MSVQTRDDRVCLIDWILCWFPVLIGVPVYWRHYFSIVSSMYLTTLTTNVRGTGRFAIQYGISSFPKPTSGGKVKFRMSWFGAVQKQHAFNFRNTHNHFYICVSVFNTSRSSWIKLLQDIWRKKKNLWTCNGTRIKYAGYVWRHSILWWEFHIKMLK